MAFVSDQFSVQINGVRMPLLSADDAVTLPKRQMFQTVRTDIGGQIRSRVFEEAIVKIKVVRGGATSGGGFMSDANVSANVRQAIMDNQTVTVRIFANDGSGRSMQGEAQCTVGEIQAKATTSIEIDIIFSNPELLNNLSY